MSDAARPPHDVYRFGPWWINAVAAVLLAAVSAISLSAQGAFFGAIVALIAVSFLVSACLAAAVAAPLLGRRVESLVASTHPRLARFGTLTLVWVTAWVLGVFVVGGVALAADQLLLAQPGVSGSQSGGYRPEPGFLAYGSPVLILYIAISGLVCLLPGRKRPYGAGARSSHRRR